MKGKYNNKKVTTTVLLCLSLTGIIKYSDMKEMLNLWEAGSEFLEQGKFKENKEELDFSNDNLDYSLIVDGDSIHYVVDKDKLVFEEKEYKIIQVDGGDRNGYRSANVAVDIGFGDRVYWALTNEYGQLVTVFAEEIILQDNDKEPVNKNGRYYDDEAYVPGTESKYYDQGHIIADSLGGVANAYNITPQESMLNREGNQAYMEQGIYKARGCSDFLAYIYYADTTTQIPSSYEYHYILKGNSIRDEFKNEEPTK